MAQTLHITLLSEADTIKLAQAIASILHQGDVLLLDGPLAAGKTFMSKALCEALGSEEQVTSPTYTISNIYNAPQGIILHVDAYRLSSEMEFHMLGLEDYVETGISIIEWGSRIREAFESPMHIELSLRQDNEARAAVISGTNHQLQQLQHALGKHSPNLKAQLKEADNA